MTRTAETERRHKAFAEPSRDTSYYTRRSRARWLSKRLRELDATGLIEQVCSQVRGQDDAVEQLVKWLVVSMRRCMMVSRGVSPSHLPGGKAVLIPGPSGNGKTFMVNTICGLLELPMVTIDSASLTGSGWRGRDLDSYRGRLARMQQADPSKPIIVFIDEADKLAKGHNDDTDRGFSPTQDLLSLIEGDEAVSDFPGGGEKDRETGGSLELDKSGLIFIFAGAFMGIEEYPKKRVRAKVRTVSMGFGSGEKDAAAALGVNELRAQVINEDFIAWGLPVELMGRISGVVPIRELGRDDLVSVLTEGDTSVAARYSAVMPKGCELTIDEDAALLVADKALELGTGARGLNGALDRICNDAVLRACGDETLVSLTVVGRDGELVLQEEHGKRPQPVRRIKRKPQQEDIVEASEDSVEPQSSEGEGAEESFSHPSAFGFPDDEGNEESIEKPLGVFDPAPMLQSFFRRGLRTCETVVREWVDHRHPEMGKDPIDPVFYCIGHGQIDVMACALARECVGGDMTSEELRIVSELLRGCIYYLANVESESCNARGLVSLIDRVLTGDTLKGSTPFG